MIVLCFLELALACSIATPKSIPCDPNRNMRRGCPHHWGFGYGDAHITLTPGASFLSSVFVRFFFVYDCYTVTAPIMVPDYSCSLMAGAPAIRREKKREIR